MQKSDRLPADYDHALRLVNRGKYGEALVAFDTAIRLRPGSRRMRAARASLLKKLLRGLATGGKGAWLGEKPGGSSPPIAMTAGPSLSDYIIEDRR